MPESQEFLKDKRDNVARHLDPSQPGKVIEQPKSGIPPLVISHEKNLNQMLKAIELTPMDEFYKQILRIRLTHKNSGYSLMCAARIAGIKFSEVLQIEEYAKEKVKDFLKKHSIQDIVNDFNQNSRNERDLGDKLSKPVNPPQEAAGEGASDGTA